MIDLKLINNLGIIFILIVIIFAMVQVAIIVINVRTNFNFKFNIFEHPYLFWFSYFWILDIFYKKHLFE